MDTLEEIKSLVELAAQNHYAVTLEFYSARPEDQFIDLITCCNRPKAIRANRIFVNDCNGILEAIQATKKWIMEHPQTPTKEYDIKKLIGGYIVKTLNLK